MVRLKIRWAVFLGLAALALRPAAAEAMTTLKQVQVSGGSEVDLLFDGNVGKSQIRTEFFNDVIQISLTDVSVYPAKISSINGSDLIKIFAYQYAPKLVRCRLTVKGKAEDYKDKLQIVSHGKQMTFKVNSGLDGKEDRLSLPAAQAVSAPSRPRSEASAAKPAAADPGQAALLEHVLNGDPRAAGPFAENRVVDRDHSADKPISPGSLAGGKPLPSPLGVIGKLAAVLAVFGLLAMIAKKVLAGGDAASNSRLSARVEKSGWLSQLTKGLARKDRIIEVVSSHYLGPKKSIAVVRIMGRMLVLGVTNDAINLITQIADGSADPLSLVASELGSDARYDELALEDEPAAGPPEREAPAARNGSARAMAASLGYGFSSILGAEASKPAASSGGVRNQIRSRLEGLKPL